MKSSPLITTATEPAHDVLRRGRRPLDAVFLPRTVAVIGASETPASVGRTLFWNLIQHPFGGTVFPVNPRRASVLGVKAYPSVKSLPDPVDLAVVATPAPTVPGVIGECVEAGVKAAIVISAGFRESGGAGAELERGVLAQLRRGRMRLIGPNCLGVMNPLAGLNATFAGSMAHPGSVGFISQSGALCTAILDWSLREQVGFSAFVSVGSMLDVGWGDLIDYLGDDPQTQSIVLYMESIGDARAFLSAAREVALTKPIVVIKAGCTPEAARAAASHTGALTGSDEVLDAAFRRCGVLRVYSLAELFAMAEVLAKQPRPSGPRLTIVTNAGGPGVLATDALVAVGGQLAPLAPHTIEALTRVLPSPWSRGNPIDILGDADPERYAAAIEIAAADPASDGLLVILTPQAMSDPTRTAERMKPYASLEAKPILASWMGGSQVAAGEALLNESGIPTFAYPDAAARAFVSMWRYSENLRSLYETPSLLEGEEGPIDRTRADDIVRSARAASRTLLTEFESKQVLSAYGIPVVETRVARDEDEAVALGEALGYPVVLKLHSETIAHKTDVGGIRLNLPHATAVRRAYRAIRSAVGEAAGSEHFLGVTVQPMVALDGYELIVGSSIDPEFGPVLLFGAGGQLVEVFKDRAVGLPPLNTTLALRMMERTRIFTALKGVRGRRPVDVTTVEQLLVRFSRLVVEQRAISAIDINPLLASAERVVALDARVILHPPGVDLESLPRTAIRPYPTQYVGPWTLADGTAVTIRPIRPEDEPMMVRLHESLSEQSVYLRYFEPMKLSRRIAHDRLTRLCFLDYDRELALVVVRKEERTGAHQILAVARLSKLPGTDEAEFAVLVNDPYQRRGLGSELLRRLIQVARDEKLRRIGADILPENDAMQRVCRTLGFRLHRAIGDPLVKAVLDL